MRSGFRAVLDGPQDGWLTVTLEAPGQRYEFFPSHVPDDSVSLLASALLSVLERRDVVVPWNDEPTVHEFLFSVADEGTTLTVVVLQPRPHGAVERQPVFTVSASPNDIVRPLWRALRALESRFSPEEYHRRWRERFPTAEVHTLGHRLRTAGTGIPDGAAEQSDEADEGS